MNTRSTIVTTRIILEITSQSNSIVKGFYQTGSVKWFFEEDAVNEVSIFGSLQPDRLKPWMICTEFCLNAEDLVKTDTGYIFYN